MNKDIPLSRALLYLAGCELFGVYLGYTFPEPGLRIVTWLAVHHLFFLG